MKYAGKIVKVNGEKVYCSYDYACGKIHSCYGLGKAGPFPVTDNGNIEFVSNSRPPTHKIPDGTEMYTDLGDFKLAHNDFDSLLFIKAKDGTWLQYQTIANFHHILYWTGACESEPISTNMEKSDGADDFFVVSQDSDYPFDAEKIIFSYKV